MSSGSGTRDSQDRRYPRLRQIERTKADADLQRLGRLLRVARERARLTMGELASKVEDLVEHKELQRPLTESDEIADIEAGKVKGVRAWRIICIAEALRCSDEVTAMLLDAGGYDGVAWLLSRVLHAPPIVRMCADGVLASTLTLEEAAETMRTKLATHLIAIRPRMDEIIERLQDSGSDRDSGI